MYQQTPNVLVLMCEGFCVGQIRYWLNINYKCNGYNERLIHAITLVLVVCCAQQMKKMRTHTYFGGLLFG